MTWLGHKASLPLPHHEAKMASAESCGASLGSAHGISQLGYREPPGQASFATPFGGGGGRAMADPRDSEERAWLGICPRLCSSKLASICTRTEMQALIRGIAALDVDDWALVGLTAGD